MTVKVSTDLLAALETYWDEFTNEYAGDDQEIVARVRKLEEENEGYARLLGSANNDVERLSKYADGLEEDNEKLRAVAEAATQWEEWRSIEIIIAQIGTPYSHETALMDELEALRALDEPAPKTA